MFAAERGEGLRRRGTAQGCGGGEIVWAEAGRKACERRGRRRSRLLVLLLLSRVGLLLLLLQCKASPKLHAIPAQHDNQTDPKRENARMTRTRRASSS